MLGVGSASSIANVLYFILASKGIKWASLGICTTGLFCVYVILQIVILKRDFKPYMFLQLAVSFIFGYFVSLSQKILAFLPDPANYAVQLLYLLICIVLSALGVVVYLCGELAPTPAEGLAQAIAVKTGWPLYRAKRALDISLMVISLAMSLLYFHGFVGIREGTVIAAVLIGTAMKPLMKIQEPLRRFCNTQNN